MKRGTVLQAKVLAHQTGQATCPQHEIDKEAILLRATKNFSHVKSLTAAKNKVAVAETTEKCSCCV